VRSAIEGTAVFLSYGGLVPHPLPSFSWFDLTISTLSRRGLILSGDPQRHYD